VLPFVNMSNDPEQEYFSDGIAEELLNALSRIKALKVAARTSAFSFKGKDVDLRDVGRKLNVATVLEGSVRKAASDCASPRSSSTSRRAITSGPRPTTAS
jgi:TolB-like protein